MSAFDLTPLYLNFELVPQGTKIIDHFSELQPFKEFHLCDENRIKIAILSGDIDSVFVRIKDRETMVRAIFDYLGLDAKKEEEFFRGVVEYKDDLTVFAWLRYLQILHETDFTNWALCKRDYDFFLMQSSEDKKEGETDIQYYKRRNETRERVKELGREVKDIEAILFPDSKAAREAAVAESKRKIRLYAESYAEDFTFK